ncbi:MULTISPECIES: primosomal replication protein PriC [unclassified Cupriavidus]|uniref:primosomal replication protein PriC n=1 Tax=unclassified Cupriavidus TaxID=2640874 RepID=UPI00088A785B|nr:primosomal replication protein PriC [Cupriavidus sp. YR651]SDD13567.1 Primosomal replication protein priC [Cupriavidus sp. YR651]
MALRSLASHSTAQLRRLIGQIQAELDALEQLSATDADAQTKLAYACARLHDGMEAIEDALASLRALQQVRPVSLRSRRSPRLA